MYRKFSRCFDGQNTENVEFFSQKIIFKASKFVKFYYLKQKQYIVDFSMTMKYWKNVRRLR